MTNFLNSVSMEYVVIGLAGALALALILVIVALVKVSKLKKRYEKFLSGKDGKSLEESIIKKFEKINEIIVEQDFLEGEIQRIDEEHKSSFSKMEVYKYNAFSEDVYKRQAKGKDCHTIESAFLHLVDLHHLRRVEHN